MVSILKRLPLVRKDENVHADRVRGVSLVIQSVCPYFGREAYHLICSSSVESLPILRF